jgi:hypothetical protein
VIKQHWVFPLPFEGWCEFVLVLAKLSLCQIAPAKNSSVAHMSTIWILDLNFAPRDWGRPSKSAGATYVCVKEREDNSWSMVHRVSQVFRRISPLWFTLDNPPVDASFTDFSACFVFPTFPLYFWDHIANKFLVLNHLFQYLLSGNPN